ncbi:hypothetical protein [Frankia sp. Cr1]|uniref:hypothetical protein n=1 Tax=Frankia sp. Cr1 TaxID=3073931 RepID=UPI002AD2FBC7|nr:hypothetical protein [Frankia sp. Cr1]
MGSLAAAFRIHADSLVRAVSERDIETGLSGEREEEVVTTFLSSIGVDIESVRFDGSYYFHGTRTVDPESFFRDGILPLGQMVDRLWSTLYDLVRNEVTEPEWRNFRAELERGAGGDGGWLYRFKTTDAFHHGPYAMLVRETHLHPGAVGNHDYLAVPEIVQDIASAFGGNLRETFSAASKRCIVKFRSQEVGKPALIAASWYLYSAIRGDPAGRAGVWIIDCKGAVPPRDVVAVEALL